MNEGCHAFEIRVIQSITTVLIMVSMSLTLHVSHLFALSESDFQIIGTRYGVPPHLLQAISIIESQKGKLTGSYEVRKVVDSTQLHYLKKIARDTGRSISDFKGSYAGAMGYMQIMPSTFYRYAQDGNGDGRKDPLNQYDSLATAAYFLARKIAKTNDIIAAIRGYNDSADYCEKVIAIYWTLELQTRFADLLQYRKSRTP